jgi:hypothetical protein
MCALFTAAIAFCILTLPAAAQDLTASLTGRAQDPAGAIIPGAVAELESERAPIRRFRTVTDGVGVYSFSGVPAGEYDLKLSRPGFNPLTVKSTLVLDGEHRTMPTLHLDVSLPCGGTLRDHIRFLPPEDHAGNLGGTVRFDEGREQTIPISGATVTLMCPTGKTCGEAKTDSDGAFLFKGLPPGEFSVRVTKAGFYPQDAWPYTVEEGIESVYWPIYLERCHLGNCNPKLRPKKPLVVCE